MSSSLESDKKKTGCFKADVDAFLQGQDDGALKAYAASAYRPFAAGITPSLPPSVSMSPLINDAANRPHSIGSPRSTCQRGIMILHSRRMPCTYKDSLNSVAFAFMLGSMDHI